LETRKRQLKINLNKNARLRYFIISSDSIKDFNENIVKFICDFLDKYHFKPAHTETPIFCLECEKSVFQDIQERIFAKGIRFTDGFIGKVFKENHFFRPYMTRKDNRKEIEREFRLRILLLNGNLLLLNIKKCDDLFIISNKDFTEIDPGDVNIEKIEIHKFIELKFLLGVSNVYE